MSLLASMASIFLGRYPFISTSKVYLPGLLPLKPEIAKFVSL